MTKVYIYKILIVSSNQESTNQNNFQNDNYQQKYWEQLLQGMWPKSYPSPVNSLLLELQTATATLEINVENSLKAKPLFSYITKLHNQRTMPVYTQMTL